MTGTASATGIGLSVLGSVDEADGLDVAAGGVDGDVEASSALSSGPRMVPPGGIFSRLNLQPTT